MISFLFWLFEYVPIRIDDSYITDLEILAVILLFVGLAAGWFVGRRMAGYIANMIVRARRKKLPLVLQRGINKVWRMLPVRRDGNYVMIGSTRVYVEPDAVHSFIGGTPVIIMHTLDAGEMTDEFQYYANLLANQEGRTLPLAEIYSRLDATKEHLEGVIDIIKRLAARKISGVTAANEYIKKFGSDNRNVVQLQNQLVQAANSDGLKPYQEELHNVLEAMKISRSGRTWKVDKNETNDITRIYSEEALNSDDLIDLAPVGNGIDDLETVIRRNEASAVKESEFNPATGIKYIVLGMVVFIIMLGVRVLLLHG